MRREMKALFIIIALVAMIVCQVYAKDTIKIGYWITEPEVYTADLNATNDKHPKGSAVDYWEKYIAPGMGVDIEWVGPLALGRIQSWLEDGTLDATVWLAKNPERAEKFLYPASSFAESQPGLALLKNNPLNKIQQVSDINKLKIGYVTDALITPFMKDPSIAFDMVSTPDHIQLNLQKLLSGRIDAIYSPDIVALKYKCIKLSDNSKLKFLPLPDNSTAIYSVFSKKANPDFIKKFEAVNETSKSKYEKLLENYVK
ncbi:MAG TPA: transporter substrate-binding domain-containing protein [Bacillota bacterium]|nr:transporter substrate-binding domain-containing protein [Bacillota bacterium]